MPAWPWLVVMVLLAVSGEYANMAHSLAPPSAYAQQVAGLGDYCVEIEATLDANPALRASEVGSVTSAYALTNSIYSNYATGPAGNPAYTLQCWMNTPIPAAVSAASISSGAGGNVLIGTAGTTSQWVPFVSGIASQNLPKTLSASQVGTVVMLTGY
jgi:hypothetical protein